MLAKMTAARLSCQAKEFRTAHVNERGMVPGFEVDVGCAIQTVVDDGRDSVARAERRDGSELAIVKDAGQIDAVSASANGSYPSDDEEAAALALVFGGAAQPPAVTAIKSVTGETLGASGPLQIVAMLEAMHAGELSGIYGLRDAGDCPVAAMLSSTPRRLRIHTAMVLSVSPDGGCCALVLRVAGVHA